MEKQQALFSWITSHEPWKIQTPDLQPDKFHLGKPYAAIKAKLPSLHAGLKGFFDTSVRNYSSTDVKQCLFHSLLKKNPKQCLNVSLVKREKPPQKQSTVLEYLQQATQQAHHKRLPATLCMYYSQKTSSMRDTQQSISFGLSLTARKPVFALQALNASSCITTTAAKYSSLPCGVQTKELRKPLA